MRLLLNVFVVLALVTTTSCMKKSVSKFATQSNITDPTVPTLECQRGAQISIEPEGRERDVTGNIVFRTGVPAYFRVTASGCSYGYQVGTSGRAFQGTTVIPKTYSSAQAANTDSFPISILNANGQVARTFQIQSNPDMPFVVVAGSNPSCQIFPQPVYIGPNRVAQIEWIPAQGGTLRSITPVTGSELQIENIYPALNSTTGQPINANQKYVYQITTNRKSGVLTFGFESPSPIVGMGLQQGACTVELIASDCDRGVYANFLGLSGNYSQPLQYRCQDKRFWLTAPSGELLDFGSFTVQSTDQSNLIKWMSAGKLVKNSPNDGLLIYRQVAGAGKFHRGIVTDLNGASSFNQSKLNQECTGQWSVPGASLPEFFQITPASLTEDAKISAVLSVGGQSVLYESSVVIGANDSSCNITAPAATATRVAISAGNPQVAYKATTVITWSAANVSGYICSLLSKPNASPESPFLPVANEANKNQGGAQVASHGVQTSPILEDIDFRASCEKSGSPTITQDVTVRVDERSLPLMILESPNSQAIRYFEPAIPDNGNITAFTNKRVFLRWNADPGASSCVLRTTPLGETTSQVTVGTRGNAEPRDIVGTTTFELSCSGAAAVSRTIKMGGAPFIKTGTAQSVSIPGVEPSSVSDRALVVTGISKGQKIQIQTVTVAGAAGDGNFEVNTACNGKEVGPGSADGECSVNVRYTAGGYSTSKSGWLSVQYKRFNADNVLQPTVYTNYISTLAGSVRAAPPPPSRRRGK